MEQPEPDLAQMDKGQLIQECERLRGIIRRNKSGYVKLQDVARNQRATIAELNRQLVEARKNNPFGNLFGRGGFF